jgi:DNA-binding HxlR family transcriptional regulator
MWLDSDGAATHFWVTGDLMPNSVSPRDAGDMAETTVTGCPLTAAITALGGKWNLIVLYWLDLESRRFNELQRLMPDISHKVLTETLRNLEQEGLIARTPRTEAYAAYALTSHGETVRPLIHAVRQWGRAHLTEKSQQA